MANSVDNIKQFLINNPEKIVELLENTNFYNVTYRRYCNQIRCSKTPESNKNGVEIYCDTLFGVIYSTGVRGDIFHIIMEHNNISFSELIKFIEDYFHLEKSYYSNKKPLFGGVYAKYSSKAQNYEEKEEPEPEYDISVLNNYRDLPSILFHNDGIDTNTQKKFHVCYDDNTSRICVPWFNENGKIVGIEGRINQKEIDEDIPKWYPIIPFKKSNHLYGFFENYSDISYSNDLYVFESTKSVMKCSSYGINNCCACGGNSLSKNQVSKILKTYIDNVIICLDEDITETHMLRQCEKFKKLCFYKKNIFYVYDEQKKYLKSGSKTSPIDYGVDVFYSLLNECKREYKG